MEGVDEPETFLLKLTDLFDSCPPDGSHTILAGNDQAMLPDMSHAQPIDQNKQDASDLIARFSTR